MEQHTLLQREESPRSPAAPSLRRRAAHVTSRIGIPRI